MQVIEGHIQKVKKKKKSYNHRLLNGSEYVVL